MGQTIGAQEVSAFGVYLKLSVIKRKNKFTFYVPGKKKIFQINEEKQGDKHILSLDSLRKD